MGPLRCQRHSPRIRMESINLFPVPSVDQTAALGLPHEVTVGGVTKAELRSLLDRAAVRLNGYAEQLFEAPRFQTGLETETICLQVVSPAVLGFAEGARFDHLTEVAAAHGLGLCPLQLGPHLRLQFLHQDKAPTAPRSMKNSAPSGSITVASEGPADDGRTPWGFYLRRIGEERWLRGYRSGPEHVWSPNDLLVFARRRAGV